jgi:hypothetical protein
VLSVTNRGAGDVFALPRNQMIADLPDVAIVSENMNVQKLAKEEKRIDNL